MGFKSKLRKVFKWNKRAASKHIISTHVEDVSLDFTGDTPRGEQKFSTNCAVIDNSVLTQILDADNRVQIALKGWEKVEREMGDKFAEDSPKVQSMRIGSTVVPTPRPHEGVPSSFAQDDISPNLQSGHKTNGGDGLEHNDSISSDAGHIHGYSSRNQTLPAGGLWVDFSDSSGSQLSRQSPGTNTTASSSHKTPFGWDLSRRGSSKVASSGCTSMDFGMQSTEKPRGLAPISDSTDLTAYSPFAVASRSPEGPQSMKTRQVVAANSARFRLRHSVTFPNRQPGPNASEREENVYSSCTSRDLPNGAWQSALLDDRPQMSDVFNDKRAHVLPTRLSWGHQSGKSYDGSIDRSQRLDPDGLSCNHKSQSVSPTSASSEMLDADVLMVPFMTRDCTKSRSSRRIPPALRVRFTPEHLRDVLMHVGETPLVTHRRADSHTSLTGV